MNIDPELWIVVSFVFFVIATLYAAVGFGGGSSYLALLSLLGVSFFFMRTNALLCNLIVVSGSSVLFYKNKLISFKEIFPFIITSIPMTFVGAILRLEETLFFIILGITLIASTLALFWQTFSTNNETETAIQYPTYFNYVLGSAIGLLAALGGDAPLYMFDFLMIRRPPRSTRKESSAASDVYKRQFRCFIATFRRFWCTTIDEKK